MATHQLGQPHADRNCLAQAGPDGPIVAEHFGTVSYELVRELLDEVGEARYAHGATDRLFVAEHFPVFSVGAHRRIDPKFAPPYPPRLSAPMARNHCPFTDRDRSPPMRASW